MARMHARRKGKSGSHRPVTPQKPTWCQPKEVEDLVIRLGREGRAPSAIGMTLRDQYGVPDVDLVVGKSVTHILEEHDLLPPIPEDLMGLMRQSLAIQEHLAEHPKDAHNHRALQLTESKIRRLVKYYLREGVLPSGWRYSRETVKLMVR